MEHVIAARLTIKPVTPVQTLVPKAADQELAEIAINSLHCMLLRPATVVQTTAEPAHFTAGVMLIDHSITVHLLPETAVLALPK